MAFSKVIQASLGLLFLGLALFSSVSFGTEVCEDIIPVDTVAKVGEKAVLKCRQSSPNISWLFCPRNGGAYQIASNCGLTPSAVDKYHLDKTNGACNLVLDNVTASDFGTYTCQDLSKSDRGYSFKFGNTNENLALNKNAIQSTTLAGSGQANKAVDGNTNPNYNAGSCTSTNGVELGWWAVDLGQETPIGRVRITQRNDCCPGLLSNFWIGLTNVSPFVTAPQMNSNTTSVCAYHAGALPEGVPTDVICHPNTLPGRYLFIKHNYAQWLQLCEVEAYYQ
jgi:hypothetical protein